MQVKGADAAVARIAARQYGVVTRAQLAAAGIGRGSIDHRIATGRLHRIHRRVYLVGHPVPPRFACELAAVLACGDDAVLSHLTATSMWSLPCEDARQIDVTVPGRDPGTHPGIRIHRVRQLNPLDVRRCQRIPITAPARTLLDLAEVLPIRALERAVEEAQIRRLVRPRQLLDVLERSPGRRGAGALRELLDQKPAFTRSEAEARLLALLRAAGLAPSSVNARVGNYEVDFLWRPNRLVVEFDGFAYHSTRAAFERDRTRDAELQAHGYRVIRVTWRQLVEEPEAIIARVAQALTRPR
jgi:very-short-patch-repair endonuclease